MKMQIYGTPEKKIRSYFSYYALAAVAGVLIFFVLLIVFKGGIALIKLVFGLVVNYWIFILGGIVVLFLIKKALFKKRSNVVQYPQV